MPQFESRISLGNILTIIALAVPSVMAWATVNAQVIQHSKEITDHESRLRVIELRIGDNLARIDERLSSIEKKLSSGIPQGGAE